ncbi:MAG: hypothetical protein ACLFU9_04100 [Candidatus Bathyarchaeia archaeon]
MREIFIMGVLSTLTLVAAFLYSKRIGEAHAKYLEAKRVIDDIILSFNRQLQKHEDQLEVSARKLNVLSSYDEALGELFENQKKEVQALTQRFEVLSTLEEAIKRIDALENGFEEVASIKNTLLQRIVEVEKKLRHREPEAKIEAVIPIKREKALEPLTETELTVLELLANGGKTAPEIRAQIKLSREHTARLMKKLYEKGYLERSANKIPFTYRLKEEMQKILKKPEPKS